jgi:guanylate kinase
MGPLIILSGPSGSGKSTLLARVLKTAGLPLRQSISATTRPRRPHERPGVDYYFLSPEEFDAKLRAGDFLESAVVHGFRYGTPRAPVDELRRKGLGVVLVIDVQGADQVRRTCPDNISIFVRTSSPEILERRLRQRRTENEAALQQRLHNARAELGHAAAYQYQVVNDDLDKAVQDLTDILRTQFHEGDHAR